MEIVKSLDCLMDLITKAGPAQVIPESPPAQKLGLKSGKYIVALGAPGDYGRRR